MQREHEMADFASRLANRIDGIIRWISRSASWLCLVLVAFICTSVVLRYFFGISSLGFDELQWHIYSASWLLGFSYATVEGTHVRNDILYSRFSELTQLRIDFYGYLFLVLPFTALVIYHSYFFAEWAFLQNEGSIDPGGLPHRWIIKSALPIGFTIFAIASLARLLELSAKIRAAKRIA